MPQTRSFVRAFLRPRGLDVPCTPLLADALERAADLPCAPLRESFPTRTLRVAVLPLAVAVACDGIWWRKRSVLAQGTLGSVESSRSAYARHHPMVLIRPARGVHVGRAGGSSPLFRRAVRRGVYLGADHAAAASGCFATCAITSPYGFAVMDRPEPRRVLLSMRNFWYVRIFESVVRTLAARGHQIHLLVGHDPDPTGHWTHPPTRSSHRRRTSRWPSHDGPSTMSGSTCD